MGSFFENRSEVDFYSSFVHKDRVIPSRSPGTGSERLRSYGSYKQNRPSLFILRPKAAKVGYLIHCAGAGGLVAPKTTETTKYKRAFTLQIPPSGAIELLKDRVSEASRFPLAGKEPGNP